MPAEVTAPSSDPTHVQSSKEKTYYLYPTLEIPSGSFFKREDINVYNDKCKVDLKTDSARKIDQVEVDLGMYSGVEYTHVQMGLYGYPSIHHTCGDDCIQFDSESMSPPYFIRQITKIFIDPNTQTVTKIETEFRRGTKGMKFENMALQMKYTCTPEFLGM